MYKCLLLLLFVSFFKVQAQDRKDTSLVSLLQMKDGKRITNLDRTHYYIGPSGFLLKQGESFYQNSYILFNTVNYGITDHFTLGGGCEMLSFLAEKPIVVFAPKIGIELSDQLHFAAGWISVFMLGSGEQLGAGLLYAVGTYGSQTQNISMGAGWGNLWTARIKDRAEAPLLTVSGTVKLSKHLAFISENWLKFRNEQTAVSFTGLRITGEKLSFGLGSLLVYNGSLGLSGIPYIDLTVPLLKK